MKGGALIGIGSSKCTIRPAFCGHPGVTSLMIDSEDTTFDNETNYALLEILHRIDPHMERFVYASQVNCATYEDLSEDQKKDVDNCVDSRYDYLRFFNTALVDTVFVPHAVPPRYHAEFRALLQELHDNGIIHGDAHGANLGLRNGRPVIFDFGNAMVPKSNLQLLINSDNAILEETLQMAAPRPMKRGRRSRSPTRSPRSPRRSPMRSPQRSLRGSPMRSPQRSPRGSPPRVPRTALGLDFAGFGSSPAQIIRSSFPGVRGGKYFGRSKYFRRKLSLF
jgi:serine/threonine protein kinase